MPHRFAVVFAVLLVAACSSVDADNANRVGAPPVCAGADIGPVVVAPQTRWRPDQKEPDKREAIATAAIASAFQSLPCARDVRVLPIRPASAPSSSSSPSLYAAPADAAGARTAVIVTVKELGPIFVVSVPVLWSGWSDVVFDLQVIDIASGRTTLDLTHHRKVGGPWTIRGVGPLQDEFETALKAVLVGQ